MNHTTVRIGVDDAALLRRIAQEDSRSMVAVLRLAIEAYARSRHSEAEKPYALDRGAQWSIPAPTDPGEWTVEA